LVGAFKQEAGLAVFCLRLDTHIAHPIIRLAGPLSTAPDNPTCKINIPWHSLKGKFLFDFAMSFGKRKAFRKAISRWLRFSSP
jgi:hypothetical protein